jgi:murein DD-endopeptidase MepM/ murein hydrolase activator NlpD
MATTEKLNLKDPSVRSLATDSALVIDQRGAAGFSLSSAATTNATLVAAGATLYAIAASNTGGAAAFVKLYDKASSPTVGTDVPVLTIAVPASGVVSLEWDARGWKGANGIALAITNLAADSDTTVIAAAQVKIIASYL